MNDEARANPGPAHDAPNVEPDSTPSETRRWAMIPADVIDKPVTLQELRLLVLLSLCTDGRSRLSNTGERYLAGRMDLSRRWIRELLRGLEKHDLIRPTEHKGPHGSTVYLVAPYPEQVVGVSGPAQTRGVVGGFSDASGRVLSTQWAGGHTRNGHIRSSDNQRTTASVPLRGSPVEDQPFDPNSPWNLSPKPKPLTEEKTTKDKASAAARPDPQPTLEAAVGDVEFDKKEART